MSRKATEPLSSRASGLGTYLDGNRHAVFGHGLHHTRRGSVPQPCQSTLAVDSGQRLPHRIYVRSGVLQGVQEAYSVLVSERARSNKVDGSVQTQVWLPQSPSVACVCTTAENKCFDSRPKGCCAINVQKQLRSGIPTAHVEAGRIGLSFSRSRRAEGLRLCTMSQETLCQTDLHTDLRHEVAET